MIKANQNYYNFQRPLKEHEKALGNIIIKNYKKKKILTLLI